MEGAFRDKYSFIGEWYDNQASLIRRFNVFYYPTDETIEMFDLKNRKTFLRRVKVNGITLDSFFIGATLLILGRMVKIVDFACEHTRLKLHRDMQITFLIIKPLPTRIAGKIITHLYEHGLRITKMKKSRLTLDDINIIYSKLLSDPTYPFLVEHLTGQLVYGMELVGKDSVETCIRVLGDKDPTKAEPGTIRALYGLDPVRNCAHTSSDLETALKDIEYFFPPPPMSSVRLRLTATLSNCTLCIVKPHAIREGKLGAALEAIHEGGFEVTALNMFIVENINAAEFYEVYKSIVQEYKAIDGTMKRPLFVTEIDMPMAVHVIFVQMKAVIKAKGKNSKKFCPKAKCFIPGNGMVEELANGPCVAMEIVAKNKNVNTAVEFRKLVGPSDPEIARLLRPQTLRAKLGNTKVQNAIHCSDLAEDGLLEVEYFFKILDF